MNRGSERVYWSDGSWSWRFNEAPIHESGKYGCSRSAAKSEHRFNEAPIHESGK